MNATADDFSTLSQIAATIPGAKGASRINPATLTRWILTGCRARNGQRLRLPATRCGSRWLVRRSDLDHFFTALAADPSTPPAPPSPAERQRAADRATRELIAAGC